MELYISEFSKYIITMLIALYTYECFAVFRFDDENRRRGIYLRQNILMFGIHFCCFIVICFEAGDIKYLFFYAFQQIILYAAIVLYRMLYPKANRLVVNNMCILLSIGFIILTRLSLDKAIRQFIIVTGSLVVALIIPFFVHKFKFLKGLKWIYAVAGILALSVVLVLGQTTYGSKLSYSIAGITFQPSEFVKIIFVFYVASALCKSSGFFEVFTTAVVAAAHVVILVCSKDLGSALIFFVVYVLMVFVASGKWIYLLAGGAGGSVAAYIAYKVFTHVQVRVQAWQDPWSVIDSTGYQISQSLFAISSGGLFGLGLFKGTPDSIPFVEADFIFSAIAEELGILFAVCLILICVSCFVMIKNISVRQNDKFYQLMAFGLGTTYIFQVFLTIGGGTKFIPLTGVTLPFISYGGSSVLTTLIMFSVIEGLSMIREDEALEEKQTKEKAKEKRKVKRYIMVVTWSFSVLFLGMIGYITHYAMTHQQELINNSYNGRQQILLAKNTRGTIYSADGEVLAKTTENENGEEIREYPYGALFSHVVGYAVNGRMGVEAQANYYLINSNAPLSEKAGLDLKEAKYPGDDVYTTLDVNLQQVASKALGVYRGAIVVTEPSTGKILAIVSKPDFEPGTVLQDWDELRQDAEKGVLLNRVTQGLYPPGSTFKIITALEYIRENPKIYNNYSYHCAGAITRGEDRIQCYHGSVHGQIGFSRSFAKSCNTSFANMGLTLDKRAFEKTLKELMFNSDLPLNTNYSKSRIDVNGDTTDSDMMQVSIGQGTTAMTPMHLNMITCAIANQGTLMKPYVVDHVENSAGSVIKSFDPTVYRKIITEEESVILAGLMTDVVTEGTASKLNGLSYTVAGKTGSAEYGTVKGDSHAWFTGFAPANDPQICVTIIIEGAGAGGDYAVPIAKRIFDAYFEQ